MNIFDISVKNYKGILELNSLKFGNLNSIVGKNDSGKSIILKALDAFFNETFNTNDIFKGRPIGEKTFIKIRFTQAIGIHPLALDNDGKLSLTKTFYFDDKGKLKIEFTYECNDFIHEEYGNLFGKKESELNEILKKLDLDVKKSGRSITNISKIETIYDKLKDNGFINKIYSADSFISNLSKTYDEFYLPDYFLFEAERNLNVDTTEFQNQFKDITTASLKSNSNLTDQIESNVTFDLEQEFAAICGYMQKNVSGLEKIQPSPICNWKSLFKFDLHLKYKDESYLIPLSNKGSGYKRLLMVAYFEYISERQGNKNFIYGIEEPETFLHPSLQEVLLNTLKDISDTNQIFLTTHSPIFAGSTNKSNITIVKKVNGISQYKNPSTHTEILDEVIKELGIRPNYNLLNENIRKVIFVEGSNDCLFWNLAIKSINGSLPSDILFIPCGGDQIEFFVNASLCNKINRKFVLILDSDKGAADYISKSANKLQIKNNVIALKGHFEMLDKREIENYYHKDAIQRKLGAFHTLSSSFNINDYDDISITLAIEIPNTVRSTHKIKIKNNMNFFSEMTRAEWISSGSLRSSGKTDIEEIVELIIS